MNLITLFLVLKNGISAQEDVSIKLEDEKITKKTHNNRFFGEESHTRKGTHFQDSSSGREVYMRYGAAHGDLWGSRWRRTLRRLVTARATDGRPP